MLRYKEQKYENGLRLQERDGILFFSVPLFEDTNLVSCAFSTRLGGVSEGEFSSMNFGSTRGDDPAAVRENFERFCRMLRVKPERLVLSRQTHTTNVRVVTESDAGMGLVRERVFDNVDGLLTNVPGLSLVTFYADCIPLLFLDPVKRVIASSHSGWRGTLNRMGEVTVRRMQEEFGCDPADILAAIAPGICVDCYEVGEELYESFAEGWEKETVERIFFRGENGRLHLDLWEANVAVLRAAGIRGEHLAVTNVCTCCNPETLFSHRASGGRRGNLAAFLTLREQE